MIVHRASLESIGSSTQITNLGVSRGIWLRRHTAYMTPISASPTYLAVGFTGSYQRDCNVTYRYHNGEVLLKESLRDMDFELLRPCHQGFREAGDGR